MAEESQQKWQAKLSAKLTGSTADQIWPLLEDYCNIHKWLQVLDTCYHIEGSPDPGQPGCIRYCSGPVISVEKDGDTIIWANEKLLIMDPVERYLSYEINESNMGFDNYVATIKVIPEDNGNKKGCEIEWSFVANPIKGVTLENFVSYMRSILDTMAKRMEEATQG
ncbi:Lachrymatory-factor synthase [Thalictrum thalictroides]|uniref:Lachrymatory-factor synthase n=1 Tax=Thalictrum thalictroides TaxID=46969 RepID=A0A7J6WXC0_THATH|nr:Lachrymatory-factor synthase [Thalictrum thalictroides]